MSRNVTIRERATTCVDLFSHAILRLAQTESSEDQNGLLDEFGRFKLWTSNIGVFADLHSSLDYRLRDFDDIKDSFTRQLITTESRLQQLLDAAGTKVLDAAGTKVLDAAGTKVLDAAGAKVLDAAGTMSGRLVPRLTIPTQANSPGNQPTSPNGRPATWSSSAQRKMARLYLFTTLPVDKIRAIINGQQPPDKTIQQGLSVDKIRAIINGQQPPDKTIQQDLSKTSIKEDEDEGPGISTSTKSTTAATFQDWNNTQLLQSIHQSIDWLHRLSNLVRKASFANQHKRADKFILKDDDDNDMSDTLTDYYTKLIKREFSGLQDTLVQRLAASMLMRRRRIMYRRSQQQRWKMPQVEPKIKSLELASTKLMPTPLELNVPLKNEKVLVSKPEGITTAPSRLTATTIDTNIRRRVSAPSGISKGSTAPLNEQSQLLISPPPKGANFGEDFVCDYCCLILPSKIALNRNAWADHVSKDLYPYVCVVDKCDDPIEIYSSRKEWLAHMSTRHLMRWYCIAKPHTQPLEFDSENGFIEHMKIGHPGKFKNDQLSLVAENSSRPKDSVFDDCPFCIGTSDNLEGHVALHLRDLALRSLPWPDDDECDSQRGEYLHSDNSISDENTRSTIVDFISKSEKSSIIGIIDDDDDELNAEEWLSPRSYFCDPASLDDSSRLREQLSDKILIRLAIKEYRGVTELSTLVDILETLLNDEYSQAENAVRLEEAIIIIQQLTKENSLDQEDSDDQSDKPYTLTEELLRVSSQLPNVRWDSIDMGNLTLSASLKGPWGKDGADIFIKLKIDVPTEYPELKAPKFIIEKSSSIPEETHKRLDRELYELAQQFAQKKQNCLETIFTYLSGEVDFEAATLFSKNNRDLSDDSSAEDEDNISVGGSASISQKLLLADADPDRIRPRVFKIAIICNLSTVYDAVCLVFDEFWDKTYGQNERDKNTYTTGRIGEHSVVLVLWLHMEEISTAASVAQLQGVYPQLKHFVVVGICGGAPRYNYGAEEVEILLGDVVISERLAGHRFTLKEALDIYDKEMTNEAIGATFGISESQPDDESLQSETCRFLYEIHKKDIISRKRTGEAEHKYGYPGIAEDHLFEANYLHKHRTKASDCNMCDGTPDALCDNVLHCSVCNGEPNAVCDDARKASCHEIGCDEGQLVLRNSLMSKQILEKYSLWQFRRPRIHFEMTASSGIVVMNGLERDEISNQKRGVIAFDMNGFDAWEKVQSIFIRGICDYADGHKDESWQNFAAATAAAATKAFLKRYFKFALPSEYEEFVAAADDHWQAKVRHNAGIADEKSLR